MTYLTHLAITLAPLLAFLTAGWLLGRRRWLPLRWGSTLCLYVFAPAQTISGLAHSEASLATAVTLVTATALHVAVMLLLGLALSPRLGLEGDRRDAFLLAIGFANAGFLGLPVCWLGFGKEGFELGVMVMLAHSLAANTVALWLAARARATRLETLRRVATSPVLLSTVLSVALAASGIQDPAWLFRGIDLVGQVSLPAVLLLLGAQLAVLEGEAATGLVAWAVGLRLVGGALVAALIAGVVGYQGLMGRIFILEMSMPTGVSMSLFALHYGCQPRFVSTVVLIGTVTSLVTIPAMLTLLA